jgi:signal transduction histidine kinase/ligand-binding sensor domain-containing protein
MLNVLLRFLFIFLNLVSCAEIIRAQSFDYGFKHLTTDNGLSHDLIHSIVKDKQGFMWFGTLNGLNRFDGFQFKVFKHQRNDTGSIPHNTIVDLACDTAGYLWISTMDGICRYNPFTERFQRIVIPDTRESKVCHLNIGVDGMVLVTMNGNLFQVDPKTLVVKLKKAFPPAFTNVKIYNPPGGRLWLLNRSALYLYDTVSQSQKHIMGHDSAHHNDKTAVMHVYTDPAGKTWIGTWDKGLYYYNESSGTCELFTNKTPFILAIAADVNYSENNLLWLSGGYSGLNVLNTQTMQVYDIPKNLQQSWSHNGGRIHAFYRDTTNGILWIGTEFGIQKYDPGTTHFARKVLPTTGVVGQFPSVGAVIRDKTDPSGKTWWVSSWVGGLYKWNRQTDEFTSYAHKLKTSELFDIEQDNEGNIWIAEYKGIQIFHPVTGQWKLVDSFIRNDSVSTKVLRLFKDSKGNMWFSQNYDGLFKYDYRSRAIKRVDLSSVLPKKEPIWVTGITCDSAGNVWVASAHHFFCVDSTGKVTKLSLKPYKGQGLKNGIGFGIAADKQNSIWLTHGDKLIKVLKDGTVQKVYGQDHGIIANSLRTLAFDKQGLLWISTDNTLHRFNPESELFRYYQKEDGLFSNNIPEQITMADNGELFVGFNSAFSYTNTSKLLENVITVPFIFTYIQVEDKAVSAINTTHVTLQPNENTLIVEFAALDYSKPEKIQYVYWIEANRSDTQWKFTSQRSLTFTNLTAGDYILHLKVKGPNGAISKEELTLTIKVLPHFYETWWFWSLIMLAIGAVLYSFYKIKEEQKSRLDKMRDRIATDLHDDMGSTLSSIRIFSDVVKRQVGEKQPQSAPLLDKISNNAAQLSENMQDIIWTIKQDNDKLEDLVTRIREFGLKLCDAKDIEFKVHISDSFRTSRLDLEQRRNLYLIFKECLNNAIKYSGCDIIQLFITQQGKHLKMVIQDNGKGFRENEIKKGNGLNNIIKRAKEIKGTASIESGNDKGTRIDVLIKLS